MCLFSPTLYSTYLSIHYIDSYLNNLFSIVHFFKYYNFKNFKYFNIFKFLCHEFLIKKNHF